MTAIGARTGREHFARFVVVAVLTGLAFMVGVQCSDGMSIAMPGSHSSTMVMPMGEHESDPDMGTGTGESLTACLLLFVAVAAAAVVLALPAVRTTVVTNAVGSVSRPESAQSRAPSLTRLCLLRI
ncbi:DUF6153 family protein [Lentzea waywayandensis]|nr:DUF6153 family protein [Lentzea waywayandensis]